MEYGSNAPALDFLLQSAPSGASSFQGDSCSIRDLTAAASGFYVFSFDQGQSQCRHLTLTAPCHLRRDLAPAAINDYLIASGTVALGGARVLLLPVSPYSPNVINEEFFIVKKTSPGAVTGTLVDETTGQALTEGQVFTFGSWIYRFSYAGGDGNDVSLKLISYEAEGTTSTWTGTGGNNLWNNGDNWGGFIDQKRICVFPAVTNRSPVHNFPAGSFIEKLRVNADGYSFLGNAAGLLSGVDANYATGQTLLNTPLILAGGQSWISRNNTHLRLSTTPNGTTDLSGWNLRLVPLGANSTIEFGNAAAGSDPPAAITGSGALSVEGPGEVHFNAPSTFTGPCTVLQVTLRLKRSPLALGSAAAGTTVRTGTALSIEFPSGSLAEPLTLSSGANLFVSPGTGNVVTLSGSLHSSGGTVSVTSGQANMAGVVTGTELKKSGAATDVLQFTGGSPFSLSGAGFTAAQGITIFARTAGLNTPTPITVINSQSILRLGAPEQLGGMVSVFAAATFDLNGHNETIPDLALGNGNVLTGTGTLTCPHIATNGLFGNTLAGKLALPAGGGTLLDVFNDDPADDITISAVISGAALTKAGEGTARLTGNNTFTSAAINDGALIVTGTNAATVSLNGGMIGGTGTVGAITSTAAGGLVSPGTSTGILGSGSVVWNAATTFVTELNGATPGTQYDQLNVTGTVNLGSATLQILPGSGAAGVMTIINNDGADAITGTFAGLPENTTFSALGKTFRISYLGGTGNDVTLTVLVSGTGVTKTWSGLGANNQWATPANWSGGAAPVAGDDLVFPASAAQKANQNNFAKGTVFNAITFTGSGYLITPLLTNGIVLNAGMVFDFASGSSTLALDVTLAGPQGLSVLQGAQATVNPPAALTTAGFSLTVDVASAAGRLTLFDIAGSGALLKTGPGGLTLGATTFTGATTLSGGETIASVLTAFGSGASAIVVNPGAELRFENIASGTFTRPLTLSGKLEISTSPITFSGAIALAGGGARVVEVTGATPSLTGVLSGSGALRKTGPGTLTLGGTAANTFTGGATVADGTLRLAKSANIVALPGPVTIGDDAGTDILLYAAANQIGNAATVSLVGSGAQFQCSNFSDTIGALRLTGGSVTGTGTLSVGEVIQSFRAATTASVDVNLIPLTSPFSVFAEDGPAASDLVISGEWNAAPSLVVNREGAGTVVFAGSGTTAQLNLTEGLTRIERDWSSTAISLAGGSLGGTGPVADVVAVAGKTSGVLPGSSPGILEVATFTGSADTTLTMEIGGLTPGTGHDVLAVRSVADPRDATLALLLLPGFTFAPGQSFTLVTNADTGAMPSKFFKLEEGTTFDFAGTTAQISYRGGDGNDVVLTILRINSTGTVAVWDGGGGDFNWMTAANWADDIAPVAGDSLLFPAGATRLTNSNNFPAGTNFHQITVTGPGYSISGNAIALNAGLTSAQDSNIMVALPVTLTAPQTFASTGAGLLQTSVAAINTNGHLLTLHTPAAGGISISGPISGSGGVLKTGAGTGGGLVIMGGAGTSTYTAGASLQEGRMSINNSSALGTGGCSIAAGCSLELSSSTPMTLAQNFTLRGQLLSLGGNHRLNGVITLPAGASGTLSVSDHELTAAGRIQGSGALATGGAGILRLGGTLANTFTGGVTVSRGELRLEKTAGVAALPGPVTIGSGPPTPPPVLRLGAANQIADAAPVSLGNTSAVLDLAGFSDTIASLSLAGSTVTTGAGTLTLTGGVTTLASSTVAQLSGKIALSGAGLHAWNVADGAASPDLQVDAVVSGASANFNEVIAKQGAGRMDLNAANTVSEVRAQAGTVLVNGSCGPVQLDGGTVGGTVGGTGTASQIYALTGGIIAPGASPGILTTVNFSLNAATTLRMEVNGTTAGTQYDQLKFEDDISFGGAALDLQFGYSPALGDSFTLVKYAGGGTILDTLAGLPQGAVFSRNGLVFQITYTGGASGHDVIITRIQATEPVFTSSNITPGTGPNASQNVIALTGTGIPGASYVLEKSADLLTWTPLQSTTASPAGAWSFTNASQPLSTPRLFVRVRLE